MLKWLYRKYLPKGGRMLCAFGGRFERYTHIGYLVKGVFSLIADLGMEFLDF